ncbi:MAG: guanylate kinase [Lachnospiraceae bacterium]|nr:guanylate kinase [Lachnospiraceae bacterium]
MKNSGLLIVLSGFAGSGKGTIMKKLTAAYPDRYALSVSATTRSIRPGEEEGRDYFFKTKEEFETMIRRKELLEYATYVGNYYGTPKKYVEEQLSTGKHVLLEIEIQGAIQIKAKFPDTLLLFVTPPSAKTLLNRMHGRGTESEDEIRARMKRAIEEAQGSDVYDYLIINDDLDQCVEQTNRIIENERCRMKYCLEDIYIIEEDLKRYLKGEEI